MAIIYWLFQPKPESFVRLSRHIGDSNLGYFTSTLQMRYFEIRVHSSYYIAGLSLVQAE